MPCKNCDDCNLKTSRGIQFISCNNCGLNFFNKIEIPKHICLTKLDFQFWSMKE